MERSPQRPGDRNRCLVVPYECVGWSIGVPKQTSHRPNQERFRALLMREQPFRFSSAATIGAVSFAAVVCGVASMDGNRMVWGVLSVFGLCGLGMVISLLGGRAFGLSIAGGSVIAMSVFLFSGVVAEGYHGILMLTAAILVWSVWASFAVKGIRTIRVFHIATGLSWGFFAGMSLLISIQNAQDSVNWPAMIPALILAPFAFYLPMLPYWAVRRWLWRADSPTVSSR